MDKKKYIAGRRQGAQQVRYAHYEGKVGCEAKKKNEKNLGPAAKLANLLEMGYPIEEAIKNIEKGYGFFVEGWLNAAKKILEKRKGLKEEKINDENR